MGITYYAINLTKREIIHPINGWKAWEIIANSPGLCEIVMNTMLNNWHQDHVVMEGDPPDWIHIQFKDITEDAISIYNAEFVEPWIRSAVYSSCDDIIRSWEHHLILDSKYHLESFKRFLDSVERYTNYFLEKYNDRQEGLK